MANDDKDQGFVPATVRMDVTIETLLKTVAAILATDQARQMDFEAECKRQSWVVTVDPALINYVKEFLGEKPLPGIHSFAVDTVRRSPGGSCFPHRGPG